MFSVFLDEGMTPIEQVQFSPGNKDVFLRLLKIDDDGLTTAAAGQIDILRQVAHSLKSLASRQLDDLGVPQFREICEFVVSNNYDLYIRTTPKSIQAIGVLSPRNLQPFIDVTMAVAAFELTLLPRLWQKKYGIEFLPWPGAAELYDTHVEKGPLITIHFALHSGDLPSKQNLHRNSETGDVNEPDPESRVIFKIAQQIEQLFSEGAYCWSANNSFGNEKETLTGVRMPALSAGLDNFRRFDAVVSLLVINPQPWVKNAITQIFEIEDEELYELWRFGYTYQTIGRCSIRDRTSSRPIDIIVVSEHCAKQLAALFTGSKIAGQCTDLPRLFRAGKSGRPSKSNIRFTRADNTAYSKYRKRTIAGGKEPLNKELWFKEIRKQRVNHKG